MARFEEVVNLQRQQLATGAGAGFETLSRKIEQFQNTQRQITSIATQSAGRAAVERGVESAKAVQLTEKEGVTQAPKFKEKRFIGGIEIESHNKALRAAYMASLQNDIREGLGKIHAENPDDIVSYNETVGSFAKGIIENVDPSVRDMVMADMDGRITSGRVSVQAANIKKDNDLAYKELELSAKKAVDAALLSARQGDVQTSANELLSYGAIVQSQVDAGFITQPEAKEKFREAELNVTQSRLIGSVRKLTDTGGFADALKIVEKTRTKTPKNMSLQEHSDLVDGMLADISEAIAIRNKIESLEVDTNKSQQNEKYNDLFIGIVDGTTTIDEITRQLRGRQITDTQASRLINTINNRGYGLDDWPLIRSIQESIDNADDPEDIRNTIIGNSGSRLTEKRAAELISSLNNSLDEESPLRNSRVQRARNFIIPSVRVTGPLGAVDTAAERRLALLLREFDERALAGEDPFEVADELVGKDKFERLSSPRFGSKENLEEAKRLLDEALKNETIDKVSYNYETDLIERIKQMKENIDAFEKAKKEMSNGSGTNISQ